MSTLSAGMSRPVRPSRFFRFLYRLRPEWFLPRRVCSWCEREIAPAGLFSRHKTSHGVCGRCSDVAMAQARAARRLAQAVVFFAAILAVSCSRSDESAAVPPYRAQMHAALPVPTPQRASLEIAP